MAAAAMADYELPMYCCVILTRRQRRDSSSDAGPVEVYLEERGDKVRQSHSTFPCRLCCRMYTEPPSRIYKSDSARLKLNTSVHTSIPEHTFEPGRPC